MNGKSKISPNWPIGDFLYLQRVRRNSELEKGRGKVMVNMKKLEPEPNVFYSVAIWFWKFTDLIWKPQRRLENFPVKEGMVVAFSQ